MKKSLLEALKLAFYSIWFFVLSFFLIACSVLITDFKGTIQIFLLSVLLNIPFILVWKKYYSFSIGDIYKGVNGIIHSIIELAKGILYLGVGIVVIISVWYIGKGTINFVKDAFNSNNWTLMVCESLMDDGTQCFNNSYEITGFKSQKECMLEGVKNFSEQGFECGRGCKISDYGLKVCKTICNKGGCT